jgi:hypothetical protein
VFARVGGYQDGAFSRLADHQGWPAATGEAPHLFTEVEGGFLIREWLRLSYGKGIQHRTETDIAGSHHYHVATIGSAARLFRPVDLVFNATGRFGQAYRQLSLAAELRLAFRFGIGKW